MVLYTAAIAFLTALKKWPGLSRKAKMMRLKDLSLKYKVPLRVAVLVIVTAIVLTATLIYRGIDDLRNNLIDNAEKMGRVIANTLVEPMLHDDVWRSFEIINTPFRVSAQHTPDQEAGYILILNVSNNVYASTQPDRFPMLKNPAAIDPRYTELLKALPDFQSSLTAVFDPDKSDDLFLLIPIQSEQLRIGTLVMSYPKSPFTSRFYRLAKDAVLITLLVLIVLLPLSIYWGQKMAAPLLQLSDAMSNITPNLPESGEIMLEESNDEIGKLGKSFKSMIAELKEKENLQHQVIASDRLAAIGRLADAIPWSCKFSFSLSSAIMLLKDLPSFPISSLDSSSMISPDSGRLGVMLLIASESCSNGAAIFWPQ